jgi:hypothetical protein
MANGEWRIAKVGALRLGIPHDLTLQVSSTERRRDAGDVELAVFRYSPPKIRLWRIRHSTFHSVVQHGR